MRIAYAADPRSGNGFYRGIGPMSALHQVRGHSVIAVAREERLLMLNEAREVDVLHIHRYGEDKVVRLAREAKAQGAAIVWDNDDDLGSIPRGTPGYRKMGGMHWERRLAGIRRIFEIADLVTAPSATLVERLREYGAPHAEVIENYIPDQFVLRGQPPREGVTIGWVAGLEHQMDVERIPIREALQRLLDERPEVRVVSVGLGLGLRGDRYRHVDIVRLFDLTRLAATFDIGIAPLSDIAINRARSNVKLKEYAAAGLPWLASPIGPYLGMDEKQGGRLVPDDGWHDALVRLIERPRERAKLAKRARKWVAGETLSKNAVAWESRFEAAIARARAAAAQPTHA